MKEPVPSASTLPIPSAIAPAAPPDMPLARAARRSNPSLPAATSSMFPNGAAASIASLERPNSALESF